MSGTFPTDPSPATASLDGKQIVTADKAWSGQGQARIVGGHLWTIAMAWSLMRRDMLAPIFAFANKQRGRHGSFEIVLPNYAAPVGTGAGSPVAGSASAGATSISSSGWTGVGDYLKAGDIFKFSNHSKVYMSTKDVNSGSTSIDFIPELTTAVSGGAITVNNVPFTMSLDDDIIQWKGSAPNLAVVSLSMTERL